MGRRSPGEKAGGVGAGEWRPGGGRWALAVYFAAAAVAARRLAEAEPLMRRTCGIFLMFTQRSEHQHPHLNAALGNYAGLLKATGLSDAEVHQRLSELLAAYGM